MLMYGLLIILTGCGLLIGGALLVIARRRTAPTAAVPPTAAIDLTVRDPWARAAPVAVRHVARSGQYQVSRDVLPGR
jgi:hypothetical protein